MIEVPITVFVVTLAIAMIGGCSLIAMAVESIGGWINSVNRLIGQHSKFDDLFAMIKTAESRANEVESKVRALEYWQHDAHLSMDQAHQRLNALEKKKKG